MKDDIADSLDGVSVSFWCQGCPFKCKGCQNPHTWDDEGGYELPKDYVEKVISLLTEDNITRNLSILGGEPFYKTNKEIVLNLIKGVRNASPQSKIYIWTGFTLTELLSGDADNSGEDLARQILCQIDYLIDGRFEEKLKTKDLPLRGSSNQFLYKNNNKDNPNIEENFEKVETLI